MRDPLAHAMMFTATLATGRLHLIRAILCPLLVYQSRARVRIQDPVCPFVRDNRESTRFAMSLLSCASQRNALVFTPPRSRLAKRYRHTVVIRH